MITNETQAERIVKLVSGRIHPEATIARGMTLCDAVRYGSMGRVVVLGFE